MRASPGTTKHQGPTPGIEEFIFKSGGAKNAAQYTEITKRLCNYFQANYKSSNDIAVALRKLEELMIAIQAAPTLITTPDARCKQNDNHDSTIVDINKNSMLHSPKKKDKERTRPRHLQAYTSTALQSLVHS